MKKYFLSIVALAGMLFATSCQESIVEPQVDGTTTFTIEVPGQMGTKAGEDSYKLFVEVYSADGTESYHRINPKEMAVGTATTVTLNLVANQAYDIIFWAQKNDNSYGVSDLRTVQMNANHHNSETGAAFYAVLNNYNPTQGKQDVKLTRPFAQLNFYTNNNVSYGSVQVLRSTIKVTNVATSFNRVADKTYGEGVTTGTYTYTSRDAENTNRDLPVGDPKNIDGVSYQYVSMDYLAVPGNEALVDIEATFFVKDSKDVESEIKRTFEGIPVQMNYRTNIIGNLITSASDFKVEISEVWGGEDNNVVKTEVSTAAELKAAIENTVGGEIVLTDDIELTESLVFGMSAGTKSGETAESDYVLDLNGRTITGTMPKSVGAVIKNNGILTIKNGTISSTAANGGSAISNYGTLNVMNATINGASERENEGWPSYPVNNYSDATFENVLVNGYQGAIACNAAGTTTLTECTINKEYLNTSSHVFYISHVDAEVVVNSGTYTHKGMDGSLAYNMGKITVNGGTFSASNGGYGMASLSGGSIEVNGGDFSAAFQGWGGTINITGGTFASEPKDDFIADGYKAVKKGGKYYVVEEDVDIVITDPAQLTKEVIENNETIYLAAGEYIINLYDITPKYTSLTIVGTEGTKVAHTASNPNTGQLRLELFDRFTIKNCEILKRKNVKDWGMIVFSTGRPDGVYTIENCTFNGVGTQGIYINEKNSSAVYHINNCTFNGDFGTEGAITIQTNKDVKHIVNVKGCEFNNIPATSHRIFLAPNGGIVYDFTLNTDLKATTAYELEMFLALGQAQLGCNLTFSAKETSANSGYGATGVKVAGGSVLDGQGHTLTVNDARTTWDCAIAATNGTIKNLTVSGAMRGIFMPGADGDVYIDNVIFDNVIYTFNSDAGNKNHGVYISNSTLNGWTSFSNVHKEVVFTNCTFGKGSGNAFCRPYNACVFENCEFSTDMEFDTSKVENIVFKNCTYGGVKITAENAASLKTGDVTFFYNGVGKVSFE